MVLVMAQEGRQVPTRSRSGGMERGVASAGPAVKGCDGGAQLAGQCAQTSCAEVSTQKRPFHWQTSVTELMRTRSGPTERLIAAGAARCSGFQPIVPALRASGLAAALARLAETLST